MKELYTKLYNAFVPPDETPEGRAASEAADPFYDRLRERFSIREADEIWSAAMDVGAANEKNDFIHGVRLGARLMLDVLEKEI